MKSKSSPPDELRILFAAHLAPVQERGKWRDREAMIPYLAIAAFCGLRAAEVQRLDWSEVHLTGPQQFIEVKASKAKTASRRTVPISDNPMLPRCVAAPTSDGGSATTRAAQRQRSQGRRGRG